MNPQTESRRRDPTAIFENQGKASDQPTTAQLQTPRAHTERVSAAGDLVGDDPNQKVTAVVRPNHNYGGVPAGMTVELSYREFDAERATLCTPQEYARMTAIAASPGHQALQRQLKDMRDATTDSFRRGLSPEKLAELETMQAKARADDAKADGLKREIAQAAAAARPAPAAPAAPGIPGTVQELEALIEQRRQATERAKTGANPRATARLDALFDEEEIEIRQAFLTAQDQRSAAAARAKELAEMTPQPARVEHPLTDVAMRRSTGPEAAQRWRAHPQGEHARTEEVAGYVPVLIEDRLATLKSLLDKGLITAEVYERRQAEIVAEV